MTNYPVYRVIRFGRNEYGFYNSPRFFSDYKQAYDFYKDENTKCDGSVLISRSLNTWELLNYWSAYGFDVVEEQSGGFRVVEAQNAY